MEKLRKIVRTAVETTDAVAKLEHDEYYGTHVLVVSDEPLPIASVDRICETHGALVKIDGVQRDGRYRYRFR